MIKCRLNQEHRALGDRVYSMSTMKCMNWIKNATLINFVIEIVQKVQSKMTHVYCKIKRYKNPEELCAAVGALCTCAEYSNCIYGIFTSNHLAIC